MRLVFSLVIAALFVIAFLIERWCNRHERRRDRKPWWKEPPRDDGPEGDY